MLLTAAVAVDRGERERERERTRFLGRTGGGEGDSGAEVVGFDWLFFSPFLFFITTISSSSWLCVFCAWRFAIINGFSKLSY